MSHSLSETFAKQEGAQELLEKIQNAKIISGSQEFYSRQAEMFSSVKEGSSVFEWKLEGKQDVLIMNGKLGQKLADLGGIPFTTKYFQYPTEEFRKVRAGQMVLGMEKAASGVPAAMIQKDLALSLIDPMRYREREMEQVIAKLEQLMDKQGMTAGEVLTHLERIEAENQLNPSKTVPQTFDKI